MNKENVLYIIQSGWNAAMKSIRSDVAGGKALVHVLPLSDHKHIDALESESVRLLRVEDYVVNPDLQRNTLESFEMVSKIGEAIRDKRYEKPLMVDGISLLEVAKPEFDIYFVFKTLDQIALISSMLDRLRIDKVVIYGESSGIYSFRTPPLAITFLLASAAAAERKSIRCIVVEQRALINRLKKWPFICGGVLLRVMLQALRRFADGMLRRRISAKEEGGRIVLCLNHARPNAITLNPALQEMKARGYRPVVVQIGDGGRDYLADVADVTDYNLYFDFAAFSRSLASLPRLTTALLRISRSSLWEDISPDSGYLAELLKRLFIQFAVTRLPAALCYVMIAKRLVNRFSPLWSIVTQEWNSRERAFTSVSGNEGCMPALIQCGLYGEEGFMRHRLYSRILCLESRQSKSVFQKLGFTEQELVVTGQPGHRWLRDNDKRLNKVGIMESIGVQPGRPIVLYAHQCYEEPIADLHKAKTNLYILYENNLRKVYNDFKKLHERLDFWLIIKPHPRESLSLHESILDETAMPRTVLLPPGYDTYNVLGLCSVLIAKYSTLCLEGVALGKPVIVLNDDRVYCDQFFPGSTTIFPVNGVDELDDTLRRVLEPGVDWKARSDAYLSGQSEFDSVNAAENVIRAMTENGQVQ